MSTLDTLLIELATEDMPAVTLSQYSSAFSDSVLTQLNCLGFSFGDTVQIATPRRFGLLVKNIADKLPDSEQTKVGPSISIAFKDDEPTNAALGWCRSNGVALSDLTQVDGPKGKCIAACVRVPGSILQEKLEGIIAQALKELPIAKRMRWSDVDYEFIRPVTGLCVMHGTRVLPISQYGFCSSNSISGHRFHSPGPLFLTHADEYLSTLKNAFVIPTVDERKRLIVDEVNRCCQSLQVSAFYDDMLLEEIACLVEYPKVLIGEFDVSFLSVPKEALMHTMKGDQKYIPLIDAHGALINRFIFVSNIESRSPSHVIEGNQRVIRPRLSDAQFFYEQDLASSLASKSKQLDRIAFQEQLGTIGDKVRRIVYISSKLAERFACDHITDVVDAASLCKADLCSKMVYEFPEVQGVMGKYYSLHDGQNELVAQAIEQHYLPRFSGDVLPSDIIGALVGIADRLDTLVGIFAANKAPKGDKDPFALRRAAIGLLRLVLEFNVDIKLPVLLSLAADAYSEQGIAADGVIADCESFIIERMSPLFLDKGFSADLINCVLNVNGADPTTSLAVLNSLSALISTSRFNPIVALNKRVNNILIKHTAVEATPDVDLFDSSYEGTLFATCLQFEQQFDAMSVDSRLEAILGFTAPLEEFFEHVMVIVEDPGIRANRLAVLSAVQRCLLSVADFSVISVR